MFVVDLLVVVVVKSWDNPQSNVILTKKMISHNKAAGIFPAEADNAGLRHDSS